jgi:hypothetical protein
MAILGQHKLSTNRSNDSSDYEVAFHRYALFLIIAGQKALVESGVNCFDVDEEDITGDLTDYTNKYINSLSSPDWTKHYRVQEELRENAKGKKGKHRQRIDIVCILTGRKPHRLVKFEAKRLKRPGFPVGKYVGRTGLGEFISGDYAPQCNTAGMLGYIQSDDCDYWAKQIPDALNKKKKEVHLTKDGQWQKACLENVNDCYKTRHNRPTVKRELLVYHLLLDFVK